LKGERFSVLEIKKSKLIDMDLSIIRSSFNLKRPILFFKYIIRRNFSVIKEGFFHICDFFSGFTFAHGLLKFTSQGKERNNSVSKKHDQR
jgi:hypothetical protein